MTTELKQKPEKSYEELRQELKSVSKKLVAIYVPKMADAIKRENPKWNIYQIKEKLLDNYEEDGWNRQYIERVIRNHASWLNEDNMYHNRTAASWRSKHAKEVDFASQKFAKAVEDIPNPPEPKEPEDETDYTGEPMTEEDLDKAGIKMHKFGGGQKSLLTMGGDFHTSTNKLFRVLCDDKYLPDNTSEEKFTTEYLRPTREYRLGWVIELEERERTYMHNRARCLMAVLEDLIDQIDKADK